MSNEERDNMRTLEEGDGPQTAIARRANVDPEVDIQVSTAKQYPRSIARFKAKALAMATLDEETAASCFYAIPRAGKTIEGPSARLAEIVASAWGNIRAEARVVDEDERFVYAEAVAWDLETNSAIKYRTRRRITDKQNKKFNDDMIAVTANAASSIALRNAVFKVVPMAYVRSVYEEARKVAIGDVKTLAARRDAALGMFAKMGVQADRVLSVLIKPSIEDIDLDDLAKLRGLATALKDGDTSIEEAFPAAPGKDGLEDTRGQRKGFGFKKGNGGQQAAAAPDPATKAEARRQVDAVRKAEADKAAADWTCECGKVNKGFVAACPECGMAKGQHVPPPREPEVDTPMGQQMDAPEEPELP